MLIAHQCLLELLSINDYSKYKFQFVSLATERDGRIYKYIELLPLKPLRQILTQGVVHISASLRAARSKGCDVVVLMEFSPKHMHIANLIILLSRKRVMFVMHGCQQLAQKNLGSYWALVYFKMFGFETIQFEIGDSVLPSAFRVNSKRNLVIPLPTRDIVKFRLSPNERFPDNYQMTIGVFGMFRQGKPISQLATDVSQLLIRREYAKLRYGCFKGLA